MKNKKIRYIIWGTIVFLYLLIVGVFMLRISQFYNGYIGLEKEKITAVQTGLQEILDTKIDEQSFIKKMDELVTKYPMEIILYKEDQKIYTTFGDLPVTSLQNLFHDNASLFKSQGPLETKTGTYTVLYNIYPIHDSAFTNAQFKQLTVLLLLLVFLVGVTILYITLSLLKPLDKLKQTLNNLNAGKIDLSYELSENNVIDRAFNQFTQKIGDKFTSVSRDYTDLEIALQFERERISILLTIARAYIHDFKTPVHQTLLENEMIYKKVGNEDNVLKAITTYNVQRNDKLLREINDVLILMDTDASDLVEKVETFDLIKILDETLQIFKSNIKNRKLGFYSDAPEEVLVSMNKVSAKIIFHNLFSNAVKYAQENSEICFEIEEDANLLILRCINEATEEDIQRMHESEQLFNLVDYDKDYSSGNGLFILRELSEHLGGTYEFILEGNEVIIKLVFPKEHLYGK